jgi:hypothetical protein
VASRANTSQLASYTVITQETWEERGSLNYEVYHSMRTTRHAHENTSTRFSLATGRWQRSLDTYPHKGRTRTPLAGQLMPTRPRVIGTFAMPPKGQVGAPGITQAGPPQKKVSRWRVHKEISRLQIDNSIPLAFPANPFLASKLHLPVVCLSVFSIAIHGIAGW